MKQEQLESQAQNAGYENGIRLAIIGSKKYANMLDQEIEKNRNEDTQSTDCPDTHTTLNQIEYHKQGVIKRMCVRKDFAAAWPDFHSLFCFQEFQAQAGGTQHTQKN
jgi:hypothetical protein